jgi:hypothetical protein
MNRRKQKCNRDRFITRLDYARATGWWVRLPHVAGKIVSKYFADKKNGGMDKAYMAAQHWRDQTVRVLYGRAGLSVGHHQKDRRNKTGIVGVSYYRRTRWSDGRGPYVSEGFSARWTDRDGVHHHTAFSVKKHGKKKAFQFAVNKRKAMLAANRIVF